MTTVGNPGLLQSGNHGYYSDQLGGPNSQQAKSSFGAQGSQYGQQQQQQPQQQQVQYGQQSQQLQNQSGSVQVMNPNAVLQQNAQAEAVAKAS